MSWILVAISAYLMLSVSNLLDKFLVDNVIKSSKAYAFIACLLGALVIVAAPWFLVWPGWMLCLLNIWNGCVFACALWLLYESLCRGEVSRVLVFIGGLTPVFSLALSIMFFKEQFLTNQWVGIILMVIGVFLIAFLPVSRSYYARVFKKLHLSPTSGSRWLIMAVISSLLYSLYFIGTKYSYSFQPFTSAFIWTRLGAALFVMIFLFKEKDRIMIHAQFKKNNPNKNKLLIIMNQGLGSLGFILQNYAIYLGSVVLVNALQGIQYAFLLIISAVMAAVAPKLLKENFSTRIIIQKSAAVATIALGLYFIAF